MVNGSHSSGMVHRAHGHHEVVIVTNNLPESNKPESNKPESNKPESNK
jgi:hypothetical protein